MEHLLDLFDLDLFKTKDIKRFEIAYQSEGKYGMKLMLYKREADNGKYDMALNKHGTGGWFANCPDKRIILLTHYI